MRVIVATILLFLTTAALADNGGERNAQGNTSTPRAAEIIDRLYAFGRFQLGLLESADLKGNQEVRSLATLRSEQAVKRDKALQQIQQAIGAEPSSDKTPSAAAALAGPDDSDGPAYVRQFYAVQVGEYEKTITLLERYLRAPDNQALGAFAREQLPVLRSQLNDTARSMADK